jgi:hypothetical protein
LEEHLLVAFHERHEPLVDVGQGGEHFVVVDGEERVDHRLASGELAVGDFLFAFHRRAGVEVAHDDEDDDDACGAGRPEES